MERPTPPPRRRPLRGLGHDRRTLRRDPTGTPTVYPQGGVLGTAHPTREQADAYVDALNNGAAPEQAAVTPIRATQPPTQESATTHVEPVTADKPPPGGWTDADHVSALPARDTSTWRSAQTYPIGTELTVHAVGEDGPGRRLGHGTVVDHDGPEHVVVESPWGTAPHRPAQPRAAHARHSGRTRRQLSAG